MSTGPPLYVGVCGCVFVHGRATYLQHPSTYPFTNLLTTHPLNFIPVGCLRLRVAGAAFTSSIFV